MCEAEDAVSQYTNSPMFQGWLASYSNRLVELCTAYKTLELFFAIDSASGAWLDLLGVIIGQPREVVDGASINFFAYENTDPTTAGFGVGKFWNGEPIVAGNIPVDDVSYRKLIKARAFKNASSSTIEDILAIVELLLDRTDCYVVDGGLGDTGAVTPDIMQFALEFDSAIDDDDRAMILTLSLLPRPAGVRLLAVTP